MSKYYHEITKEEFDQFYEMKIMDNEDVMKLLQEYINDKDDRRFNFSLLNIGTLMKICATELEFKSQEIEGILKLTKEKTRDRKMAFILKELNKKINLRYDFDEKTEIVPFLYTYKGRGYIFVEKYSFLQLIHHVDIDIETLENV